MRLIGQGGVYRVTSELMLRGHNVLFPAVDTGADIVVDGGVRLQVKTASLSKPPSNPRGQYTYHFQRSTKVGKVRGYTKGRRFSEECDFVVLYGIEHGRFWIVPASLLDDIKGLTMMAYEVAWEILDKSAVEQGLQAGKPPAVVSRETNVSLSTVLRVRDSIGVRTTSVSQEVRKCEGRWDFIQQFMAPVALEDSVRVDA